MKNVRVSLISLDGIPAILCPRFDKIPAPNETHKYYLYDLPGRQCVVTQCRCPRAADGQILPVESDPIPLITAEPLEADYQFFSNDDIVYLDDIEGPSSDYILALLTNS